VAEAGQVLGVSRSYAYELVRQGQLPCMRLGRRIVVPVRALEALLDTANPEPAG
jgi:excisionase family DNA binding protein